MQLQRFGPAWTVNYCLVLLEIILCIRSPRSGNISGQGSTHDAVDNTIRAV